MTACVAEARDVGEGERERGKKERGLGQRRSGEWDREGAGSGTENERARFL